MRKLVFPLCAVAALAGCANANPQTRDEFRKMNLDGAPFSMVDSHVSSRRFDDVVGMLKRKTAECFNVDVTTRRTQGGVTTMKTKDEFRTTVRVVHSHRAELTTQYTTKGAIMLQQVPEGGFYHRAVDIERVSATRTKVTYYGSRLESGMAAWNAIKSWSDGQNAACP